MATTNVPAIARPGTGRIPRRLVSDLLAPAAFIVAILVTNYALSGLPNVKLMDLLVLTAGFTLGFKRGAAVAVGAWLVYGNFNPWGFAQGPLLLTMMSGEVLYAAAGAFARRLIAPERMSLGPSRATLVFVAAALVVTPAYDLITNVYTGYYWATIAGASDYGRWITVALFNPGALFFMAVHAGANLALFPVFGPLLVKGAERFRDRS